MESFALKDRTAIVPLVVKIFFAVVDASVVVEASIVLVAGVVVVDDLI